MALFFKAEIETEVIGDGEGFIQILQGEQVVWLSVNQFENIVNQEKHIVREAFGIEKAPEAE